MEAEKADLFDSDFNDSESDAEEGSGDEREAKRSQKKEAAGNVSISFYFCSDKLSAELL